MFARRGTCRATIAVALAATLVGCSSNSTTPQTSLTETFTSRGPITLASGKDTTGTRQLQLDRWNTTHPDQKVTMIELPEQADQQRQKFIQNAQTKSGEYTIINLDTVWVPEFAANGWIMRLPEQQFKLADMLPSVVETGKYFIKLYAVPYNTNAGLLFYRKDLLSEIGAQPPKTWAEMQSICRRVLALPGAAGMSCYAGQFEKYEGLSVNFAEAVQSAGGSIIDANGHASVNTAAAKHALQTIADGFTSGMIPKEAITYTEENSRRAFQEGKLVFHRQWPYQWVKANTTDGSSKVAGKFDVTALPGITGPGRSSLGGADLAISSYASNKATALDFIAFITNADNARKNLDASSLPPVYSDLYDDAGLQAKFPYLAALKASLVNAVARPKVIHYGDVTAAIQDDAYAALTNTKPVDQALADMQRRLDEIIAKN
jgi:multiple sugar transport system substrate-binding protein